MDVTKILSAIINDSERVLTAIDLQWIPNPVGPRSKRLAAPKITSTVLSTTSLRLNLVVDPQATTWQVTMSTNIMMTENVSSVYTGSDLQIDIPNLTTGNQYFFTINCVGAGYILSPEGMACGIPGNIITLPFPNTGDMVIDLSIYPKGTNINVTGGTHQKALRIQNGNGHAVNAPNLILDGINQSGAGFDNVFRIEKCVNTILKGVTVLNNGYHPGYITGFNEGGNTGIVLDNCIEDNCAQGVYFTDDNPSLEWDGTDNTVYYKDFTRMNCVFISCDSWQLPGMIGSNVVINLTRNFVDAGNTFSEGGNIIISGAVDGYKIFNNYCHNLNLSSGNDNRLYMMQGWGDVYDNFSDNIYGHFAACYPVSFGQTLRQSNFHHNILVNSLKYSAFEFQEFAQNLTPFTSKANLSVYNNTIGHLNYGHHAEFNANFIDNYMYGIMGGETYMENNLGYDFWMPPAIDPDTGEPVVTNLNAPASNINNKTCDTKDEAVDGFYNSLFSGVGAQ